MEEKASVSQEWLFSHSALCLLYYSVSAREDTATFVFLFMSSPIKYLLTSSVFEPHLLLSGGTARAANIQLEAALVSGVISM